MSSTKYLEDLQQISYAVVTIDLFLSALRLKAKSITKYRVLISLSCGILVYNV